MSIQENALVSVIVPVYNVEKYIARCIESILSQTYENLELILVDDGSPDQSGSICDDYANKDSRILVIHQKNAGVSTARNVGIDRAKGKYLFFVDSDDWIEPNHVESLLPVGSEDWVYCGYNSFAQGKKISDSCFADQTLTKSQWCNNFSAFWHTYTMRSLCRGCYRTEIIRNHQLQLDQSMTVGEDEQFNLQYFSKCRSVRFSCACTYNYETGEHASALHRYHPNRAQDCIKICRTIEDISQQPEYTIRWYYWHAAFRHLDKCHQKSSGIQKREVCKKMSECFNEPYFRECLPYMRKHGTLDERIETFFMRRWLHPLYKPMYSGVVFLSKIKNYLLRK